MSVFLLKLRICSGKKSKDCNINVNRLKAMEHPILKAFVNRFGGF